MNIRFMLSKRSLALFLGTIVFCGVKQNIFAQTAPEIRKTLINELMSVNHDQVTILPLDQGLAKIVKAGSDIKQLQIDQAQPGLVGSINKYFSSFTDEWSRYQCSKACCEYLKFAVVDKVTENMDKTGDGELTSTNTSVTQIDIFDNTNTQNAHMNNDLANTKAYKSTLACINDVIAAQDIDEAQKQLCLDMYKSDGSKVCEIEDTFKSYLLASETLKANIQSYFSIEKKKDIAKSLKEEKDAIARARTTILGGLMNTIFDVASISKNYWVGRSSTISSKAANAVTTDE